MIFGLLGAECGRKYNGIACQFSCFRRCCAGYRLQVFVKHTLPGIARICFISSVAFAFSFDFFEIKVTFFCSSIYRFWWKKMTLTPQKSIKNHLFACCFVRSYIFRYTMTSHFERPPNQRVLAGSQTEGVQPSNQPRFLFEQIFTNFYCFCFLLALKSCYLRFL